MSNFDAFTDSVRDWDFGSAKPIPTEMARFFHLDARHSWICRLIETWDEPHDRTKIYRLDAFCRSCSIERQVEREFTYAEVLA